MKRRLTFSIYFGDVYVCSFTEVSKLKKSSLTNHLHLLDSNFNSVGFLSIEQLKNNLIVTHKQIIKEYNTICISYMIQLKDVKK